MTRPHPPVRTPARTRDRTERGAAAVEFALVVPLLLCLLFAVIGYGYMLSFRQAISQAAAEGARTAAVTSPSVPEADLGARTRGAVNQALSSYGVECTAAGALVSDGEPAGVCAVSARRPCSNDASAQCVEVGLDYTYRDDPLIPSFPGLGVTLPASLSYATEAQVG